MIRARSLPLAILAAALAGSAGCARAELFATPVPGDTRLVQFEYDADNTFLVLGRPKSLTHLEFGADERIQTVAGGDTKHWELTPTQNRRHLFVKPIHDQIETSENNRKLQYGYRLHFRVRNRQKISNWQYHLAPFFTNIQKSVTFA